MRFNIAYLGPIQLAHLRRDFILLLKYGLEAGGHAVDIAHSEIVPDATNLIIGAYFQPPKALREIEASGYRYININTEVIGESGLNHNPAKTDLQGSYLPFIRRGIHAWDVIPENCGSGEFTFLRWGYCQEMEEIKHREKDLDWYFFGTMSERRKKIIASLPGRGFADHACTYMTRNDRIARAKVNLNIVQADKYTHVNSFRVCYLAQNRCAVVTEKESDPAGYLDAMTIAEDSLADAVAEVSRDWRRHAERAHSAFKARPSMAACLEAIL